jgi:DNA-binding MarR family transcriptional regulator
MQPGDKLRRFLEADDLLSNRVRFAVMVYLSIRGRTRFKKLEERLSLTPGNLSSHLDKLESAGYVKTSRPMLDARGRLVSMTPIGLAALADSLSRLKDVLAEEPSHDDASQPSG